MSADAYEVVGRGAGALRWSGCWLMARTARTLATHLAKWAESISSTCCRVPNEAKSRKMAFRSPVDGSVAAGGAGRGAS